MGVICRVWLMWRRFHWCPIKSLRARKMGRQAERWRGRMFTCLVTGVFYCCCCCCLFPQLVAAALGTFLSYILPQAHELEQSEPAGGSI